MTTRYDNYGNCRNMLKVRNSTGERIGILVTPA